MRFTQDVSSGIHVVRGYTPGEIWINDRRFAEAVILTATELLAEPQLRDAADLADVVAAEALATRALGLSPEVVLLGTGVRQVFPAAAFGARFLRAGVGFEVMDTGAACRTFNVLVAERRRALAVLLP
jgi:uncharacterized protein